MKRFASKGLWSLLEYMAYPALMLGLTPHFLKALGESNFGIWMLISTAIGMGGLAGIGVGPALIREVSIALSNKEEKKIFRLISTSSFIVSMAAIVFGVALYLLTKVGADTLFRQMGGARVLTPLILYVGIIVLMEQLDVIYSCSLRGMGRFDLSGKIEIALKTCAIVTALLIAKTFNSVESVMLVLTSFAILKAAAKHFVLSRLLGSGFAIPRWSSNEARVVMSFGRWSWLQTFGGVLFSAADRLIIGSILGPESVARYSVCTQLAQQIHAIPSAALAMLFPYFSSTNSSNKTLLQRCAIAALASLVLALAIAAPLLFAGDWVLTYWYDSGVAQSLQMPLIYLSIAYIVLAINVAPHYLMMGLGEVKSVAMANLGGGVAASVAAVFLALSHGFDGASASKILYGCVVTVNMYTIWRLMKG